MYNKYNFVPEAEWNFGTDIMDLYRSIMVRIKKEESNTKLVKIVSDCFKDNADGMQVLLDRYRFCSEVHVLMRINHD
jgi:hypothetical protein